MGCGQSSKVLAGGPEPTQDAANKYAVQSQEQPTEVNNEGEPPPPPTSAPDGFGLTNLEDINDPSALKDDMAEMRDPNDGLPLHARETTDEAEEKLRQMKADLKQRGMGTKKRRSTNKGLIIGGSNPFVENSANAGHTPAPPKVRKGAPLVENSANAGHTPAPSRMKKGAPRLDDAEIGEGGTLPLSAMGVERRMVEAEKDARGNLDSVTSLAAGDGKGKEQGEFQQDDFDF